MGHTGPRPLLPRGPGSPLHRTPRHPVAGMAGKVRLAPRFPHATLTPRAPRALGTAPPMGCATAPHPGHPPWGMTPQSGAQDVRPTQPAVGAHAGGAGHTRYPRGHPVVAPSHGHPGAVAALTPRGPEGLIATPAPGVAGARGLPDPPPAATGRRVHEPHPVPTRSPPSLPPVYTRGRGGPSNWGLNPL